MRYAIDSNPKLIRPIAYSCKRLYNEKYIHETLKGMRIQQLWKLLQSTSSFRVYSNNTYNDYSGLSISHANINENCVTFSWRHYHAWDFDFYIKGYKDENKQWIFTFSAGCM